MQSGRSVASKTSRDKTTNDEAASLSKKSDDKQRSMMLATPRNYPTPKTSAADIYSQKKKPTAKTGSNPATPKTTRDIGERDKVVISKLVSKSHEKIDRLASVSKGGEKLLQRENSSSTFVPSKSSTETSKSKNSLDNSKNKNTLEVSKTKNTLQASKSKSTLESSKSLIKSIRGSSKESERSLKLSKTPKSDVMTARKNATPRTAKDLPFVGLLVNSPPSQRRNVAPNSPAYGKLQRESSNIGSARREKQITDKQLAQHTVAEDKHRQRGKTRTLDDKEVKIFTPDAVDNNFEMKNLTQKLRAKPKAFFVDLDDHKESFKPKTVLRENKIKSDTSERSDEENYSYEDDFDSYESDFESYQSESANSESDTNFNQHEYIENNFIHESSKVKNDNPLKESLHTVKMAVDEEKMLDSGNFDLREDQRSATQAKPAMGDIQEDSELGLDAFRKQSSLTDEGFLDMSSSSAVSGMRTLGRHSMDRPSFIDLSKAKDNKKRRLMRERQRQRAADLLSMISLHQVSYVLFDMKPIAYEKFMAIYGNVNGTQTATQTYDDGVTEEIQTDDIFVENKWTQYPVAFSHHEIHITKDVRWNVDLTSKFDFLWNAQRDKIIDDGYKNNPLRIFLDQKHGVGPDRIVSNANYEVQKKPIYNGVRLSKFLLKAEKKLTRILRSGDTDVFSKKTKWPFSDGYKHLFEKIESNSQLFCLHKKPVCDIVFSDVRESLILTVHKKIFLKSEELQNYSIHDVFLRKCLICLWDLSVGRDEDRFPVKVLAAVENVALCRFKGGVDGLVVAALHDGSLHLWDLSEQDSCHGAVTRAEKAHKMDDGKQDVKKTSTEQDREWNYENNASDETVERQTLRSCAYTNSALSLSDGSAVPADHIAGLEFLPQDKMDCEGGGRMVGQICSLQRYGVLTLWMIVQEKKHENTCTDIGKAYWSKMKLQKGQVIHLCQDIGAPLPEASSTDQKFNLSTAKRRNTLKRTVKRGNTKEKIPNVSQSSNSIDDFDSWDGVASSKNELTALNSAASDGKRNVVLPLWQKSWESGVVCTDLKVMCVDKVQRFLVARNCGEVVCCTRSSGFLNVKRYKIGCNASTVTALEVSRTLPYFLAGTDSGYIHLYSLAEARTLLALDCKNCAKSVAEKYHADKKGRYLGSVAAKTTSEEGREEFAESAVMSIHWFAHNPCSLLALSREGALCQWDLTLSDIAARWRTERAGDACGIERTALARGERGRATLAVLTSNGTVEVHQVSTSSRTNIDMEELFRRYVTLL